MVCGVVAALSGVSWSAPAEPRAPTFAHDAAPILFQHCVRCHRSGQIGAAQSLLSYEDARRWAAAIKTQVLTRRMPPWPADPVHSLKFRNDARLEQRDIDTLVAWVDAGAPQGNAADLPAVPAVDTQWLYPSGRAPDAVIRMPAVTVAATGEIPYVQQRVKVPLAADKWIVAMQVRPGNELLVHHMGITEITLAEGVNPDDLDALTKVARQMGMADDAFSNPQPAVVDAQTPGAYDMLGVYTPGTTFEMYDSGSAKLLKSGRNNFINFNIHYTTTGRVETNRSELGLWFQSMPPKHQLFRAPAAVGTLIANGRQLLTDDPGTKAEGTDVAIPPIPPFAANYELDGITAYVQPITIYQLQPHAHMRAKDFTYRVVYPDGHEVTVLTVPAYDFHWQLAYDLETPLALPAGSKLVVTAHYDNSANNTHLREAGVDPRTCGPEKQAYFRRQNQSWHEMFSPLIQYSVDRGDTQRDTGSRPVMVQTVGCLARKASHAWWLRDASKPEDSVSQSTSAAALRTAAREPHGENSYRLLGVDVFAPQRVAKRRVQVKGVLIPDAGDGRLNVTSLQPVPGNCL